MKLSSRLRALAVGSLLALTVLSLPTVPAYAAQKSPDNLIRCARYNPKTDEWEFYLPGEWIYVKDSHGLMWVLTCKANGQWTDVGRTPAGSQVGPAASSTVYTQP